MKNEFENQASDEDENNKGQRERPSRIRDDVKMIEFGNLRISENTLEYILNNMKKK